MPSVEAVTLKLFPLLTSQLVTFSPYRLGAGLGLGLAHPGSELLGCQISLTDVGTDSRQVLCVDHGAVATTPESYTITRARQPSPVTY